MQKATTDKLSWSALAFIQLLYPASSFHEFPKMKKILFKKANLLYLAQFYLLFSGKMHVHAKRQYAAPGS
jgi:hypothetical protein